MYGFGDDETGFAGAVIWAAGAVTRDELEDGTIELNGGYTGGVLTKPLILFRSPVELLEAATKSYVDSTVGTHSGNSDIHIDAVTKTLLAGITVSASEINSLHGINYSIDLELMKKVDRSGDTMTGMFTLFSDPVDALHAATKQYVDGKLSVELTNLANSKINKYGDVMTGQLTLSGNPSTNLHAVPKQYVDGITTGLNNRLTTVETTLSALSTDPVANTVSTPVGVYPGNNALKSGTLLMDGRVFMTPANSSSARVYDPYTGVVTTLPDVYPLNNFVNTVLLPNGVAMMVPTSNNRCRVFNTTFMPVPMAICTSPFYNHK